MHRLLAFCFLLSSPVVAQWTVQDRANDELPGRVVDVRLDGKRVAAFVYGEGQLKPYLAVYDSAERRITNPGISPDGKEQGRFPHHRGIYIGWNKITSDLGSDDLWHLRGGEKMEVAAVERVEADDGGARILLDVRWLSKKHTAEVDGLLVAEKRVVHISRPDGRTLIHQTSELNAARDIRLGGDLQHAGLHFRADAIVDDVRTQTRYLWEPADLAPGGGRIVSDDLKWVNFRFPLHEKWFSVSQLNPASNGSKELSWRDYGRFGFFFDAPLAKGEKRTVTGFFLVEEMAVVGDDDAVRAKAAEDFKKWVP